MNVAQNHYMYNKFRSYINRLRKYSGGDYSRKISHKRTKCKHITSCTLIEKFTNPNINTKHIKENVLIKGRCYTCSKYERSD